MRLDPMADVEKKQVNQLVPLLVAYGILSASMQTLCQGYRRFS
jgi:hypothetical protein